MIGVLEGLTGGTNADDLHPEGGAAADIYHRKCYGRGCHARTKDEYAGPPVELAAMLLASGCLVALFLCGSVKI